MTTININKGVHTTQAKPPLDYSEACRRYAEWAELETANHGVVLFGVPQPNNRLSEVVGSTWRLRNINGPLATVKANGRVFRLRKEDN